MDNFKATATAVAHSNIALVKYWGKRNSDLNLPAAGSISLTLEALYTRTQVSFESSEKKDVLLINNEPADDSKTQRVSRFLDLIRQEAQISQSAIVSSTNSFPTGAGLASSASAFAALTMAALQASGLQKTNSQISALARRGSGSAARSIYGGFVEMQAGRQDNGEDAFAVKLASPEHWDIRLIIAVTSTMEKKISSTLGMQQTAKTSPYYASWVSSLAYDLDEMRLAIKGKDFQRLGELAEHSCLKMHGLAFSANPALVYWNAATMQLIEQVYVLRNEGVQAYFTIDAGPQVKIICQPADVDQIISVIKEIPAVKKIIPTKLGPDAYFED